MKIQDDNFLLKRAKIRKTLIMTKLNLKNQTYQKLMGQQVNKKYDSPLSDSEVSEFDSALANAEIVIKEMRDELRS